MTADLPRSARSLDAAGRDPDPARPRTADPKTAHNRSSCVSGGERQAPIGDDSCADSVIEQCMRDPARFIEVVFGVELSPWHASLIRTREVSR